MLNKLFELIHAGGAVMPPLIVGSSLLWYGLAQRIQFLQRGDSRSVRELIKQNFSTKTPFLRYLLKIKNGEGQVALFEAQEHFSKFNTLTTSVIVIAPLLGLLGTVTGMIETFNSLGNMSLFSQSGGIAGGISQALVSTQMGLVVAIPGLVAGRILSKKQKALMIDLQQAVELEAYHA